MCLAALLLLLSVIFVPIAAGQPLATPVGGCVPAGGSPVPEQATPATPPHAASRSGSVTDLATLVDALRACGVTVEVLGSIEQPFLRPETGIRLRLAGGSMAQPVDVQVFEYRDATQATADASTLSPDGSPPTMIIDWIAPPHFFQAGRVIVLYLGDDRIALDLLTALLGEQVAGR